MPGFNINEFASHIHDRGVLNSTKFMVRIVPPKGLLNTRVFTPQTDFAAQSRGIQDLISFRAESVRAPGVQLNSVNNFRYGIGPAERKPFGVFFSEIGVNFLVDRDAELYAYFYSWLNLIFNFSASNLDAENGNRNNQNIPSYTLAYKDNYQTTIDIDVYDESGESPIMTYKLLKAFPINISDVPLNWAAQSSLIRLNVNFSFREFVIENFTSLPDKR